MFMVIGKRKTRVTLNTKLENLFGLDLRSLAVFRIGLALIIITDLMIYAGGLTARYSEPNALSHTTFEQIFTPWYGSVHSIVGQHLVQGMLFFFAGLAAFALIVGYETRLAAIAAWALVLALHNRNPLLIFTTDDILLTLTFWAMFLPLGACYSIDSAMNSSPQKLPQRILSGATIALIMQQSLIYLFPAPYTPNSLIWLAWFGILLLFVPFRTGFFRCCAIAVFILLHVGLALTLNLGFFPTLSIVSCLAFLPSSVWDSLYKRLSTPERRGLKIYYDAECGFCKKVVHLFRTFLILPGTPLLLAQEEPTIFVDMQAYNSWVIVDWQGNRHFKFEALAYVIKLSPLFWSLVPVMTWNPVMSVGTKFYETIAINRRAASKFTKPLKFRPLEVCSSGPINILALLLLTYALVSNLRSHVHEDTQRALQGIEPVQSYRSSICSYQIHKHKGRY